MNGRIGTLRCRYRVVRPAVPARAAVRAADEVARHHLPPALSGALDRALDAGPAVYVVRAVRVSLVHHVGESSGTLARRWGESLAGAVAAALAGQDGAVLGDPDGVASAGQGGAASSGPDGATVAGPAAAPVVRFDDDAHFRARFLADLLDGIAWRRWYYGAFAALRGLPTPEAVRRVLLEAGAGTSALLARLHRIGALGGVLAVLDRDTQTRLWQAGLDPPEAMLPLVEAALRVADRRGWWAGPRPRATEVLRDFLATRPLPGNWRDRGELTAAVAAVLRMLAERGDLRPSEPGELGDLDDLDWLDVPALPDGLPVRPPGAPTPRQRRLLDAVRRVMRPGLLPDGPLNTPANALTLLAAVTADDPSWTGDVTAAAMVERYLASAGSPGPVLVDTPCAGAFLLLRAVADGRAGALARRHGLPDPGLVVLALAMRWAGPPAISHGRVDSALSRLAGRDGALPLAVLRDDWSAVPADAAERWAADVRDALAVTGDTTAVPGGELGLPDADRAIGAVAGGLLRHWARWLRGFDTATSRYLLTTFVRRPGRLRPDGADLVIELEPRPLDPVLALAGYLDDFDATPVLGAGRIRFRRTP